jgi:hypothetical protein
MEQQYYYLVSGLIDLVRAADKQTVFIEPFVQFLEEELHPDDWEGVRFFLLSQDNRNLLHLLTGKGIWTSPSVFTREEMEAALKSPLELPEYMQTFIPAYRADAPLVQNLVWEDQLAGLYYEHIQETNEEFICQWFQFEQNLKNVLAAFNCRKHQLPLANYLVGKDDAVVDQLLRSTALDFGLGREYPWVESLAQVYNQSTSVDFEKAVDDVKWAMADELAGLAEFTRPAVYAYFIKLSITERWFKLIPEVGAKVFEEFVTILRNSFTIDEELLK